MLQLLASKYQKPVACFMLLIFYMGLLLPVYSMRSHNFSNPERFIPSPHKVAGAVKRKNGGEQKNTNRKAPMPVTPTVTIPVEKKINKTGKMDSVAIDGPSQPEMSSFKPAGTNDMVNLFTGDFSYNIPLLDVGGYPVNIFYDGGISMEQEASWVGLGWNINPGNINRNMRGVPDDFNGEEKLNQSQNMKKNITWGVSVGADLELFGTKQWDQFIQGSVGVSLGYSLNNYLGPAIELGLKGGTSFRIGAKSMSEKGPIGVSAGLSANLNSRSGMTLTPNLSLSAKSKLLESGLTAGIGISTSYNSRSGIKGLQLYNQVSAGYGKVKDRNKKSESGTVVDGGGSIGANILSSTISFTKPSYIPSMRSVITNSSGAGRFQLGGAMFGVYPSFEVEGYGQVSTIEPADQTNEKPMVGYLYAEQAKNNRDAVMDFTRFNDQEITPTTTIVSVPQYSYDVFSIQGEGTGGTIRAYRNDNGYIRDNFTVSKDKSWSAGVDVGIPGHVGVNFNTVKTPSSIGEWNSGNKLRNTIGFGGATGDRENVYFRNPGENSVLQPDQYDSIGGTDLVRYKLGGTGLSPTIEPKLQRLIPSGAVTGETDVQRSIGVAERKKRTQVTSFLTAEEASIIGLDKKIKSYDPQNFLEVVNGENKLKVLEQIDRVSGDRKAHHISQINVTEADGKRYVYGIPVYNLYQTDFSFTIADNCYSCDLVPFTANEASVTSSPHIGSGVGGKDGYVQVTKTPPYAHSFLLSGLLSPDYTDVTGDGITEDDLGTAVKFNYTKVNNHKWRTPLTAGMMANSNPGNLSENRDDKAIVSCGDRESWYLHSVESKTMIAFFILDDTRMDGKGAADDLSGINNSDNSLKKLKQIDLYNKADLKKNGMAGAKPVKTVHFQYSYSLCNGTPDNPSAGGKLTLEKIWFTYNGQIRANKNQYVFSYGTGSATDNPSYAFNSSDRWGNYKLYTDNPESMKNRDYPYSVQNKAKADQNANAWILKKILLPSGGQLEMAYESDDYAFVENKRAAVMSGIIGFSNSNTNPTDKLYTINGDGIVENDYIFIRVPESCSSKSEVYQKYLQGLNQLAVKLLVNMPKGQEYLTSYATIADYGVYSGNSTPAIWIRMNKVEDKGINYSPLSMTAIEFLRERLPGQAFKAYDVTSGTTLDQIGDMFQGLMEGIATTFSRIPQYLREKGKAQHVELSNSFARLDEPAGFKYGGGHRVKRVTLKDNWNRMTSQYGSTYGQEYDYTTKEIFNGAERTISSGVASYEPSIGGEENPFQSIVQISNEVPLGPTSYGAIETPVMDAFFPAPLVGYSKVTVTSIGKKQNPDPTYKKTRSGTGRQVTEFYTAKDFPVYYNNTPLDPSSDKQQHTNPTLSFFYKFAFDARAVSQGFIVATNDMHGKMKSQSSYAENDPNTRINYTENFYRNTGAKGLDEKFDFAYNSYSGEVRPGNMGIDIELMTDTREFSLKSNSFEIQAQVDWMLPPPFPLWLPFVWPVVSESENTYRAVTTTKVISYHAVLDSVVVIDKGSKVSTKNLVYDAETGQVIVNRTNNEFDKAIYSVNYPAYWAYSGMGLAYKNIDAVYSGVDFLDGKIINNSVPLPIFESGDELYVMDAGGIAAVCDPAMASSSNKGLIWVLDKNKNTSSLTNINPELIFIDKDGKPYSRSGIKFRIVRSGHRNMLGASLAGVTLMSNPIDATTHKLTIATNNKVINASAVEYKEKWQADNEVFNKYSLLYSPAGNNLVSNGDFENGNTGFSSEYLYGTSNTSFGYYFIGTDPALWNGSAISHKDHTSGAGKMMMVDGAVAPVGPIFKIVWSQMITVTPNTDYTFSTWVQNSGNSSNFLPVANLHLMTNDEYQGGGILADAPAGIWKNWIQVWNSGNNTNVTLKIVDFTVSGQGNNFELDDLSFKVEQSCTPIEIPDCNGYLEKSINPYVKGLLGNFRGYRNMVFYGEKNNSDPAIATNLPVNGYLNDFNLYWNFDGNNNLVPDASTTSKWVWNSQSTRFNAKGMELETKDALNIYTAAQYGYNKTTPTAIASNSRYDEMMYEGFEDYGYAEKLSGATTISECIKKHIDFSGIANSSIVNTDSLGFNAHSGKYILAINPQSTVIKNVPVSNNIADVFSLDYETEFTKQLNNPGGSFASFILCQGAPCPYFPSYLFSFVDFNNCVYGDIGYYLFGQSRVYNNFGASLSWDLTYIGGLPQYPSCTPVYLTNPGATTQYLNIEQNGYYDIQIGQSDVYGSYAPANHQNYFKEKILVYNGENDLLVANLDGPTNIAAPPNSYTSNSTNKHTLYLCKGVYKINFLIYQTRNNVDCFSRVSSYYSITQPFTSYASLSSQNGCSFTKPVSAAESMINPTFSIPATKKMLFSAWVKESCGNAPNGTPCTKSTYTDDHVDLQFMDNNGQPVGQPVTIIPTGAIIEGWQRYEGYFLSPGSASSMDLRLINNSSSTIYFDDIRIHPFNANMKSYVYDPVNLRLTAELDANNYASFYEYDEEGTLIRTKAETKEGVKTITESRSAKQKNITDFQ